MFPFPTDRNLRASWRPLGVVVASVLAVYVLIVAGKGMLAAYYTDDFPEALALKLEAWPWIFRVHMVAGALALLLVPATIIARYTWAHKVLARIAAADIVVAGITAFPVAATEPITFYSGAGFMAQAIVWLALLGAGIYFIKQGRVRAHQTAMLLMAAVTSGAVFFRLWLGLWAMTQGARHFVLFYSVDAWIGWLLPLSAMAAFLWSGRRPTSLEQDRPAERGAA